MSVLVRHGLKESPQGGRATVDSVFSRLVAMESPSSVSALEPVLRDDVALRNVLFGLGAAWDTHAPHWSFTVYSHPAGTGRYAAAGPGRSRAAGAPTSRWHSYDGTDGIPFAASCLYQDSRGHLWCGSGAMLVRYDGQCFTTYGEEQGIRGAAIRVIHEDSRGVLWVGGDGGVVRYDGQRFTRLDPPGDGVGHDVYAIYEDGSGSVWSCPPPGEMDLDEGYGRRLACCKRGWLLRPRRCSRCMAGAGGPLAPEASWRRK